MSGRRNKLAVAIVQVSAGGDISANLARILGLVQNGKRSDLIALPEVFAFRGGDAEYRTGAERIPGMAAEFCAALARKNHAWVLAGSIIERSSRAVYNTSVLFDRGGRIAAMYRKMHLFEARLDDGQVIRERNVYAEGGAPVMVDVDGWKCGMAVCYDLRFPELFRYYARRGADILFVPSNFTQRTGRDHWDVLVRARAIENQCYVVAPDQCGRNPVTGVRSHGHSLVVGPWGEVEVEASGSREQLVTTMLDSGIILETRRRIPVLNHARIQRL